MEYKVSVLCPTYNRAEMLKGAIESFINQDYKNCEMFVLNNGSTDNTDEVIRFYQDIDPRIKWLKSSGNLTPPENFNYLLSEASGDLICHLHDDDRMLPNGISLRVEAFKNDPKLQVVYAGWITNGREYHATEPPNLNLILQHEYISYITMMWKREEVNGFFDTDFRYNHDWLFKIKCLKEYKCLNILDCVIDQGVHLGQDSVKCRVEGKSQEEKDLVFKKVKELYGI